MQYCLGIDVGTSYTAAGVTRPGGVVEVAGLGPIADNFPTVLYFGDDGSTIVGDAANRRSVTDPSGSVREFKRRLGDPTPIIVRTSPYSPESLVAKVLTYVVQRVSERERVEPAPDRGHLSGELGPVQAGVVRSGDPAREPRQLCDPVRTARRGARLRRPDPGPFGLNGRRL